LEEELLEYRWRVVVDTPLRSLSARRSYLDPLDQVLEKDRGVDLAHDRAYGTTSVDQKDETVAWLVCTLEDIVSNVPPSAEPPWFPTRRTLKWSSLTVYMCFHQARNLVQD
jgi:hypothetical protein